MPPAMIALAKQPRYELDLNSGGRKVRVRFTPRCYRYLESHDQLYVIASIEAVQRHPEFKQPPLDTFQLWRIDQDARCYVDTGATCVGVIPIEDPPQQPYELWRTATKGKRKTVRYALGQEAYE